MTPPLTTTGRAPPVAPPLPEEAISFAIERQRHAGFVGRERLLLRIDHFTHRGDARFLAVAVSATTVIAGDAAGVVWFLDMHQTHGLTPKPLG